MRCEEFRRELEETGSAASPGARAHAAACPACARAAATWEEARAALRELGEEAPPPFLHARVMAHLRAADRERARRTGRRWLVPARAVGALAALLAVSFAGWMAWQVRPDPAAPASLEETRPGAEGETFAPEPSAPLPPAEPDEAPARLSEPPAAPPAAAPRTPPGRREAPPAAPAAAATRGVAEASPETGLPDMAATARTAEGTPTSAAPPAPPYPGSQRREPPQRGELATQERAPGLAPSVLSGAAPPAAEKASPAIPCTLVARTGGARTALVLPAALAPAPGEQIALTLHPDGTVVLGETDAERLDAAALREHLRALGLPPGDYLLRRDD